MTLTIISLVIMILVGAFLAISGGYSYHKRQSSEESDQTTTGMMSMLGSVYVMSFGGMLLLVGIYLLHGLLTGEIPLSQ